MNGHPRSDSLLQELQQQVRDGQAVVIVGAGVSIGATGGASAAGWPGLLHHGVDRCGDVGRLDAESARRLHEQIDTGDLDQMLAAAEVITRKLDGPGGGEWSRWLRESVGTLPAQRTEVLEALRDLGVPLATTNYDGLLETATGRPPVTWRAGNRVERVLRGDEQGILHLHGHWREPESVILGVRDYEKVLGDAHARTMQHAMRAFRTLLFVGCGEGLHDPNFGALLRWSRAVFPGSEYRHFRLAPDGEVGELQKRHPPEERIFVLGYGPDHGRLAGFLRGLRASAPSASPASPAPGGASGLPPAPRCFGREAEIADLAGILLRPTPEPVAILGGPGIGKSTLTLQALNDEQVAARYGERRYFVRCDAVRTREALVAELSRAVGLPIAPPAQAEAALLRELASAPGALAIDNAETPWEADTLPTEELLARLAAAPGLALIASLRGTNRPFGVPWREPSIQLSMLPLPEARKVFLATAGARLAGDPHLDALLTALDGIPLAITLLASAAEGEADLEGTWQRWQEERTRMLRRAGGSHRLLNLEASYELSIRGPRMTEEARRLLSLLGCLPAGVAQADLAAVFPQGGARAAAVLRQVGLVFHQGRRFRPPAPLREYLQREHPPLAGDLETADSHYLGLATSLGVRVGAEGGAGAVMRLAPESSNVELAIRRGLGRSAPEGAITAAIEFGEFNRFTGLGMTESLEAAATGAGSLDDPRLAARCFERLGDIALTRSDHEQARSRYEAALPLYQRVGAVLGEANCIKGLGDIALERSDHEQARSRYEAALPLYQRVGSVLGEANCIKSLGDIALRRSDHEQARSRYEAALPLYQRVGSVLGEANCIQSLGDIALARSDHEQARSRYEAALPLYQRVGDVLGEANCILSLGDIALRRSDHEQARSRYEAALEMYERIPEPYSIGSTHRRLARLAPDDASRQFHTAAAREAWESIGRDDLVEKLDGLTGG